LQAFTLSKGLLHSVLVPLGFLSQTLLYNASLVHFLLYLFLLDVQLLIRFFTVLQELRSLLEVLDAKLHFALFLQKLLSTLLDLAQILT
jgi:hypothetical protein